MMVRRRVRFDGSLMGPATLHTEFGEQAPETPVAAPSAKTRRQAARISSCSIARVSARLSRANVVDQFMSGKVAVLGAGAWGTALARLLAEQGTEVALF